MQHIVVTRCQPAGDRRPLRGDERGDLELVEGARTQVGEDATAVAERLRFRRPQIAETVHAHAGKTLAARGTRGVRRENIDVPIERLEVVREVEYERGRAVAGPARQARGDAQDAAYGHGD